MDPRFDGDKVSMAMDRLKLWGDTLTTLAREDIAPKLIDILEAGDRQTLEKLFAIHDIKLFQIGVCIDIVDTITKVINFGSGKFQEIYEFTTRLVIEPASKTQGRVYALSDGSFVFVSDREWADYRTRAQQDPAWLEQNKIFLRDIGIITIHHEWVPDSAIITLNTSKTMCFPTVISP